MKKGMLFASGIALALGFTSCNDGSARIGELEGQLGDAQKNRQAALDSLSLATQSSLDQLTATYQYQIDSLQFVIDSLTAPKGTKPSKPKPKPTTTTTTTTPAKTDNGGKLDVGGSGTKLDVKGTTDTTSGKKGSKLNVKP